MDSLNAGGADLFGQVPSKKRSTRPRVRPRKAPAVSEPDAFSMASILFGPQLADGLNSRIRVVGVAVVDPAMCSGFGGSPRAELPFDPRLDGDLMNDVEASGIRVPIIVRKGENGAFAILSGNRRTRVVRELRDRGVAVDLPAVVIACEDADAIVIAHFSNTGRQRESAMQQARAILWAWKNVFGEKQVEVAKTYRYDPAKVCRLLFLADLPSWILAICKNSDALSENVAGKIQGAMSADAASVEERARRLAAEGRSLTGPELARALEGCTDASSARADLLIGDNRKVGYIEQSKKGRITVKVDDVEHLESKDRMAILRQVVRLLRSPPN